MENEVKQNEQIAEGGERLRAEFEEWMATQLGGPPTSDGGGGYAIHEVRWAWMAWKAAHGLSAPPPSVIQGSEGGDGVGAASADAFKVSAALRMLIADDAYAMTFQTFGQYRTALLKAIDAATAAAVVQGLEGQQHG